MKPTLDMFIFTAQLSRSLGFRGTALLFLNYYATVKILRAVTPAFGRLAAVEAMLEGEYRTGMNRVGRESEEIAFYAGGARERSILWSAYLRLIRHINSIYKVRTIYRLIPYGTLEFYNLLYSFELLMNGRRTSLSSTYGLPLGTASSPSPCSSHVHGASVSRHQCPTLFQSMMQWLTEPRVSFPMIFRI